MPAVAMDEWLAQRIAGYLSIPVDDVDHDRSLADYGLDSVYAVSLCGEIEDEFGLIVEQTLAYDYPTVAAMTEHLNSLRGQG